MKTNPWSKALFCILLLFVILAKLNAEREASPDFALYCPDDVWVSCDAEIWDLSIYGYAYIHDYGQYTYLHYPQVHYHLNSCGSGYVEREWKVKNHYGAWIKCSQIIHVGGSGNNSYHIDWPESPLHITGCNPNVHPSNLYDGYPKFSGGDCSLMGYSYHDLRFNFGPGCEKIIRTWKVIDWCNYNPNSYNATGIWTFTQVIKVSSTDTPVVSDINDVLVNSASCADGYVYIPDINVHGGSCSAGYQITNDSPYATSQYGDASGYYPVGTTQVHYSVEYGCGQHYNFTQNITVESNAAPTPYCIYALSTALMPIDQDGDGVADSGMVDIWAKDFDKGSYHACDTGELIFAFDPEGLEMTKTFTCDDLGENELRMYVIDAQGNSDYCTVILDVQNNAANIQNCSASTNESDDDHGSEDESADESDDQSDNTNEDESENETNTEDEDESSNEDESNTPDDEDATAYASISGGLTWLNDEPVVEQDVKLRQLNAGSTIVSHRDTVVEETVLDSFYNQSGTLIYHTRYDSVIYDRVDTLLTDALSQDMSDDDGLYGFYELTTGGHYKLELTGPNLDYSRIDNDDAHAIYNHAIGIIPITDPLRLVAGDLNRDGRVDLKDFKLIVDYLLGEIDAFTANDELIFINKDYDFDNAATDTDMMMSEMASIKERDYLMDFYVIMPGDLTVADDAKRLGRTSDFEIAKLNVSVFPNPVNDQSVIEIFSYQDTNAQLLITDQQGKVVSSNQTRLSLGDNQLELPLDGNAESGMYYLSVVTGSDVKTKVLVKQ